MNNENLSKFCGLLRLKMFALHRYVILLNGYLLTVLVRELKNISFILIRFLH